MNKSNFFKTGDVVCLHNSFPDDPKVKIRPLIVLWDKHPKSIFLNACTVTSIFRSYETFLKIRDWKQAGLKNESYAQLDNISTYNKSNLILIGELSSYDLAELQLKANELFFFQSEE